MAKKKQEDPPKGAPAWMNTFSDLMNLLLCFFVLLFSMSTVDTDKLEAVVASLQNAISILPDGDAPSERRRVCADHSCQHLRHYAGRLGSGQNDPGLAV